MPLGRAAEGRRVRLATPRASDWQARRNPSPNACSCSLHCPPLPLRPTPHSALPNLCHSSATMSATRHTVRRVFATTDVTL